MDAITAVFGREKGGFLKGVGYGVTASRYWKGSGTKERLEQLELLLHNERLERQKKDEELKNLSMKMAETADNFKKLFDLFAAQGIPLPREPVNSVTYSDVSNLLYSLPKHFAGKFYAEVCRI